MLGLLCLPEAPLQVQVPQAHLASALALAPPFVPPVVAVHVPDGHAHHRDHGERVQQLQEHLWSWSWSALKHFAISMYTVSLHIRGAQKNETDTVRGLVLSFLSKK